MARSMDELTTQLQALAGGKLREYLGRSLKAAGLQGEATARLAATTRLRVRTGRLRSSITHSVTTTDGLALRLQAGGGRKPVGYAAMQEFGGTQRPRRGQYLTVPLPDALTAAGALRARFAVPGGLRQVPGLFLIRSGAGNLLIVERKGKSGIRALFVLRRSVKIRGVHYLQAGADAAIAALPDLVRDNVVSQVLP